LISLDTFRWDAIDIHDSRAQQITPNLDSFSRDCIDLVDSFAHTHHTLPSHASMLTGLYPDVHQVLENSRVIPTTAPTMAETLRQAGYRTAGVFSTSWLKHEFGFARGFDRYDSVNMDSSHLFANRVNERAFELIDKWRENREAFFLFLHYYDAHSDFGDTLPYYSPPDSRTDLLGSLAPGDFCDEDQNCATWYLIEADRQQRHIPNDELNRIHSLYEAGIKYLDQQLGVLFEHLKETGLYEESLIVLTADHGEEFREHGRFIHTQLYDEILRIPLLIKLPRAEFGGLTTDSLAETVDIFPTVLDYLRLAMPDTIQGSSLLPAINNGVGVKNQVFGQVKLTDKGIIVKRSGPGTIYSLRTADYKLILDVETKEAELYDLKADPKEQTDISADNQETVRHLAAKLRMKISVDARLSADMTDTEAGSTSHLTAEESEQLKALGYVD